MSIESTIAVQIPLENVEALWQGVNILISRPRTHAAPHYPSPACYAHHRNLPARSALTRPWPSRTHSAVAPDNQCRQMRPRGHRVHEQFVQPVWNTVDAY